MTSRRRSIGFTLVEMIMVIVILGVISGVLAVFIVSPVQGYFDSVRRAELADTADTALRRIGRDLRRAVPNSVRVNAACAAASCYLEFLPTTSGGRYRAAGEGITNCTVAAGGTTPLHDTLYFTPDTDTCFEILGPPITFTAGDQIIIGNWGSSGSDAYAGNTGASHVRRAIPAAAAASSIVVMTSANPLPLESPSRRFQIVAAAELAVTYACEGVGTTAGEGTGTLRRYSGYGIAAAQPIVFGAGISPLIAANVSSCVIVYDTPSARNGVVAIVLGITRGGETINLYHEIHVDNLP